MKKLLLALCSAGLLLSCTGQKYYVKDRAFFGIAFLWDWNEN